MDSPTSSRGWRTIDIVTVAVLAVVSGVVFWAWNLLWTATGPAFAAFPPAHIRRLRELFPQAQVYSMYGLTECTRVAYLERSSTSKIFSQTGRPVSVMRRKLSA